MKSEFNMENPPDKMEKPQGEVLHDTKMKYKTFYR